MIIQLIVTGDAEREGLAASLATLFPSTGRGQAVGFLPAGKVLSATAMPTTFPNERAELAGMVRERCSFHLFAPMLETYFFGEPAALRRAGTSAQPQLLSPDVEAFETNDPAWLPTCRDENARRADIAPWWRHERHPKHYLEHLVERDGGFYTETAGGVRALRELDWNQTTATGSAFARALFEDLASSLGVPNPQGPGPTAAETWPTPSTRPEQLVLRNL